MIMLPFITFFFNVSKKSWKFFLCYARFFAIIYFYMIQSQLYDDI